MNQHANPFTTAHIKGAAYPDTIPINLGVNRVSFLSVSYQWLVSIIFGSIFAHSFETYSGYILTACITFLFLYQVTKSYGAALVGGFIYGFWPQMYSLARADATYTHMWLYILPIWAFWTMAVKGVSKKRIVLASASIIPAVFWTPYFAFHALIVGICCLTVAVVMLSKKYSLRKVLYLGCAIFIFWTVLFVLYRLIGLTTSPTDIPTRTLSEIYLQSAHPLMYLFPGAFSGWGAQEYNVLVRIVPRAAGTNLYVGLSVILLSIVGSFYVLVKHRQFNTRIKVASLMATVIVMSCFVFSLPPTFTIFKLTIPTPNDLVAHVVPALRAGQRFVMPLMSGLAILSALGTYVLIRRMNKLQSCIVVAIVLIIVGVDLFGLPPEHATVVPKYNSLVVLKQLPEGAVAYYQKDSLVAFPAQTACLLQNQFNKPLVNDCGLGRSLTDPAKPSPHLASIINLPLCEQLVGLKAIHTKYVIVTRDDKAVISCLAKHTILSSDYTFLVLQL